MPRLATTDFILKIGGRWFLVGGFFAVASNLSMTTIVRYNGRRSQFHSWAESKTQYCFTKRKYRVGRCETLVAGMLE